MEKSNRPIISDEWGEEDFQEDPELANLVEAAESLTGNEFDGEVSDDHITDYLREIAQTPLLTREEELTRARELHEATKNEKAIMRRVGSADSVEPRVIRDAQERVRAAENALVKPNLRLVVSVAKKYLPRRGELSLMDLVQAGNIGLLKGVRKYDYRKGYKLSTYATWWIRQGVVRAIDEESRMIRIPVHARETRDSLLQTARKLESSLERVPTFKEIADAVGVDVKKVIRLLGTPTISASLDAPVGGDDDKSSLGDLLPSPGEEAFDVASEHVLRDLIKDIVETLPEKERIVIQQRYGLVDGSGKLKTLQEVGNEFGITRERVRQIEEDAFKKIRKKLGEKGREEWL